MHEVTLSQMSSPERETGLFGGLTSIREERSPTFNIKGGGSDLEHYKIIMLGDATVGKTSLIDRLLNDKFEAERERTSVPECSYFSMPVAYHFEGSLKKVQAGLQLWDTLGQERHSSIVSSYFKNAFGVMIVFDVGNNESFQNARDWLMEAMDTYGLDPEHAAFVLVGNKVDLNLERVVSSEMGEKLAAEFEVPYREVSAKSGSNVHSAFTLLASSTNYS